MKVCYFTATGNCLYVAKQIGGDLLSIPQLMKQETNLSTNRSRQASWLYGMFDMIYRHPILTAAWLCLCCLLINSGEISVTSLLVSSLAVAGLGIVASVYHIRTHDTPQEKRFGVIIAVAAGTVVKNSYDYGGYGYFIVIEQNDGIRTYYGHMRKASFLSVGAKVKAGDTVGIVGSTGRSTGNHLHLEFRSGTKRINPLNYYPNMG